MKNVQPLNNNILVRRLKTKVTEQTKGGIIIPQDSSQTDPTEEVEVIAISPDLALPEGKKPSVKKGDRVLIRRGVLGTPIGDNLMVGYSTLVAIVS